MYAGVPPDVFAVAVPLLAPQFALVRLILTVIAAGCVIVTACALVHPTLSVTIIVKVPAHILLTADVL